MFSGAHTFTDRQSSEKVVPGPKAWPCSSVWAQAGPNEVAWKLVHGSGGTGAVHLTCEGKKRKRNVTLASEAVPRTYRRSPDTRPAYGIPSQAFTPSFEKPVTGPLVVGTVRPPKTHVTKDKQNEATTKPCIVSCDFARLTRRRRAVSLLG